MTLVYYDSWISYVAQLPFVSGVNLPNKTQYKLIFLTNTNNSSDDTRDEIFSREVIDCPRFTVNFTGPGTFNSSLRRHTLPDVLLNLSHSDDRQFQTSVLVANCPFNHSTIQVSSVNISTDTLQTTGNHNLQQDDPVMLFNELDDYPDPTDGQTLYYADVVSSNQIKLLDDPGGSVINLTGTYSPSEPLLIRPAVGDFVFYKTELITITIPSVGSVPYTIRIGKEQS